jgi:hypothetical protein
MHNNDHDRDGAGDDSGHGPGNRPGDNDGDGNGDSTSNGDGDGDGHTDSAAGAPDPRPRPLEESADDDEAADTTAIEESLIEESLHHALSNLEQILERHEGDGLGDGSGERVADEALIDGGEEQYVIPLLDEVVIASPSGYTPPPEASANQPFIDADDEPALRKRLAERLASEIEIITQDLIEAALETAREEIRVQVRNHLDIMLPEIVEELHQLRRRPNGNPEQY